MVGECVFGFIHFVEQAVSIHVIGRGSIRLLTHENLRKRGVGVDGITGCSVRIGLGNAVVFRIVRIGYAADGGQAVASVKDSVAEAARLERDGEHVSIVVVRDRLPVKRCDAVVGIVGDGVRRKAVALRDGGDELR